MTKLLCNQPTPKKIRCTDEACHCILPIEHLKFNTPHKSSCGVNGRDELNPHPEERSITMSKKVVSKKVGSNRSLVDMAKFEEAVRSITVAPNISKVSVVVYRMGKFLYVYATEPNTANKFLSFVYKPQHKDRDDYKITGIKSFETEKEAHDYTIDLRQSESGKASYDSKKNITFDFKNSATAAKVPAKKATTTKVKVVKPEPIVAVEANEPVTVTADGVN